MSSKLVPYYDTDIQSAIYLHRSGPNEIVINVLSTDSTKCEYIFHAAHNTSEAIRQSKTLLRTPFLSSGGISVRLRPVNLQKISVGNLWEITHSDLDSTTTLIVRIISFREVSLPNECFPYPCVHHTHA